jgi:APA family basic amino acid/polyamine antiporter
VIVVIKVAIVIVFILAGAWFVRTANGVTPANPTGAFIPHSIGSGQYGWKRGGTRGSGSILRHIGLEAVSTAAQEARNPKRDMPIGILGSLAICTVLYVLVAFVLTGIAPMTNSTLPIRLRSGSMPSA